MYKYALMVGRTDEAALVRADDNKAIKEYIAKGYGIMNRVKAQKPINIKRIRIAGDEERRCADK